MNDSKTIDTSSRYDVRGRCIVETTDITHQIGRADNPPYVVELVRRANAYDALVARLTEAADMLDDWWKAAGSPVHATEIVLWDARALLASLKETL